MAAAAWWYFFSKFTEFFDTFFFLARKKFDNVSTLHVIHHGIMPFFAWQACRFVPGILKSVFFFSFSFSQCSWLDFGYGTFSSKPYSSVSLPGYPNIFFEIVFKGDMEKLYLLFHSFFYNVELVVQLLFEGVFN
jgi:hypothetical protein